MTSPAAKVFRGTFLDTPRSPFTGGHLRAESDLAVVVEEGRIVARGTRAELLQGRTGGLATTLVTALDNDELSAALSAKGMSFSPAGAGYRVTAAAVDVGRLAAERAVVLTDLRSGDEGGLEDLFLELTADAQRDDLTHGALT